MDSDAVDKLLERYLHLVHEYTTLRAELSGLQADVFHQIARANFSAERGMRYGQDFYDDRMQASQTLKISVEEYGAMPTFRVLRVDVDQPRGLSTEAKGNEDGVAEEEDRDETTEEKGGEQGRKVPKTVDRRDPLRWFGLLTPMPLRQAQAHSIKAVAEVIPKLSSVSAEMAAVEIEVRRARKRRAKAEAAAASSVPETAPKQQELNA